MDTAPATIPAWIGTDAGTNGCIRGGSGKLVARLKDRLQYPGSIDYAQKVDQIAFDADGARLYCAGAAPCR